MKQNLEKKQTPSCYLYLGHPLINAEAELSSLQKMTLNAVFGHVLTILNCLDIMITKSQNVCVQYQGQSRHQGTETVATSRQHQYSTAAQCSPCTNIEILQLGNILQLLQLSTCLMPEYCQSTVKKKSVQCLQYSWFELSVCLISLFCVVGP